MSEIGHFGERAGRGVGTQNTENPGCLGRGLDLCTKDMGLLAVGLLPKQGKWSP